MSPISGNIDIHSDIPQVVKSNLNLNFYFINLGIKNGNTSQQNEGKYEIYQGIL